LPRLGPGDRRRGPDGAAPLDAGALTGPSPAGTSAPVVTSTASGHRRAPPTRMVACPPRLPADTMKWDREGTPRGNGMKDYQIQASRRRCASTGREIRPGEAYYSVLLEEGGTFTRRDYSESAWAGPPAGALGFWRTRLQPGQAPRRLPIDDELLLGGFQRLEGQHD